MSTGSGSPPPGERERAATASPVPDVDAVQRPINERIAVLLGWTFFDAGDWPKRKCLHGTMTWYVDHWHDSRGKQRDLAFSHSLDALQEAEQVLVAQGWTLVVEKSARRTRAYWIPHEREEQPDFYADTEAEARAKALEAALTALASSIVSEHPVLENEEGR